MRRPRRRLQSVTVATLAAVLVAGLAAAVGVSGPDASAAPPAALRVTPQPYTGGQLLTWTGRLGVTGKRRLMLQRNLNRRGDQWKNVQRVGVSAPDGSFRFRFPGPVMNQIKFRVRSRDATTPAVVFRPKAQEAVLTQTSAAVAGRPFAMAVDTVPDLVGRPNLPGPVLEGRGLTLQRRELTRMSRLGYRSPWRDVTTSVVDSRGRGRFTVSEGQPGTYVYRARLDDWARSGDRVGWLPSFPVSVRVGEESARDAGTGAQPRRASAGAGGDGAAAAPSPPAARTVKGSAGTTNGTTFRWHPSRFDFDWPYGESFDSVPFRGTRMRGRWVDSSTGNGRAVLGNGGLELVSQPRVSRQRDHGTTSATLRGNAAVYGRWEVHLRTRPSESRQQDFRAVAELVPDAPRRYRCGAHVIRIADVRAHGSVVRYGARSGAARKQWAGRRGGVQLNNLSHRYAVEVARDHITWFMDGKVLGTVRNRRAAPPMMRTLRLRLMGPRSDHNRTKVAFDWVRSFPLDHGRQVRARTRPSVKGWRGGC